MRGICCWPPRIYNGVASYRVYSQRFMVRGADGSKHMGADTRQVQCLPDDVIEIGDHVEFLTAYPQQGYVHDRVIVKHRRSAESDLPVLPYVPFGAG